MTSPEDLVAAASLLRRSALQREPIAPLRGEFPGLDLAGAYAIQKLNTAHRMAGGARVVGSKIGLTSLAVQRQLGVDQPDFGMLFDDMAYAEGLPIPMSHLMQPKIEAEVAFVLGRDLDLENPGIADLLPAIEFALPALEIVGSRIRNWEISLVDTVADNASSSAFVLGGSPRRLTDLDLRNCRMQMHSDGELVSSGQGSACLGHPLNALAWLAGTMARKGAPLKAGYLVLSGALGPMVQVRAGATYTADIEGLGSVSATFGAE